MTEIELLRVVREKAAVLMGIVGITTHCLCGRCPICALGDALVNAKVSKKPMYNLDKFTRAYIECALQHTYNPEGKTYKIEDIDSDSLNEMMADCKQFQAEHLYDICDNYKKSGYYFWLTRYGHGVRFWDPEWPDARGRRLVEACKAYGRKPLRVSSNGKIYC